MSAKDAPEMHPTPSTSRHYWKDAASNPDSVVGFPGASEGTRLAGDSPLRSTGSLGRGREGERLQELSARGRFWAATAERAKTRAGSPR